MSLTFGANTTDLVSIAASSSINNLDPFTYCWWMYVTTWTGSRDPFTKIGSGQLIAMQLDGTTGAGNLKLTITGSTGSIVLLTTGQNMAVNTWYFCAATYNSANSSDKANIYVGTLATPVALALGSGASAVTGTHDDSANPIRIGNNATPNAVLQGDMAWLGVWNKELSLAQLKDQQYFPHVTSGNVVFMHLNNSTTGTQLDQSGLQNKGTVTGATPSTLAEPAGVNFYDEAGLSNNYQSVKVGDGMSVGEKIR